VSTTQQACSHPEREIATVALTAIVACLFTFIVTTELKASLLTAAGYAGTALLAVFAAGMVVLQYLKRSSS
jgi:hypothetical protein